MILDDEELAAAAASPRTFRDWREPAKDLAASRIFGGGLGAGAPAAAGRQFPVAFHTYRPVSAATGGPTPFHSFKGRGRRGQQPRSPARVEVAGGATTTEEGALRTLVRQVFDPSGTPLQVTLPADDAEAAAYPYSACTPPAYSPKTPPYFPVPEPDGVSLPPAALEGVLHQSGGEA